MSDETAHKYVTVPPPAHIEKAPVCNILDEAHQSIYQRAIQNILSTEIAETTLAQIIEGLPLRGVAQNTCPSIRFHEAVIDHRVLDPEALERFEEFRENFEPLCLELQVEVLQRYQDDPAGSEVSRLHLIELVAVAVHRIAVLVYKRGNLLERRALQEDQLCYMNYPQEECYQPTPFIHLFYSDPAQYQEEGVAELPGYWAEDQIFGGVVVFDRGENGTECKSLWLHPGRSDQTPRIAAVNENELSSLMQFLTSEDGRHPCPLPILVGLHARGQRRHVAYEVAMPEYDIYRDRWERKVEFHDFEDYCFRRVGGMCVIEEDNFSETFETHELYEKHKDDPL